ncbi:PVC-type heme-binding CxxCH protein [Verrucomicrobium spinosum]|uniref:PVC-type heme-binding CxxCH protein n=2 Tax=Verrucomicrobium spinosum TaxID=2736 RepID=UPI0001746BCD|nr:PVC-type heme-binding CxxCH protein [Verrucomicrobium spinosum]
MANVRLSLILTTTLALAGAASAETLIRFEKQQLETRFFGEGSAVGDLNRDGKSDIVYGPYWWEGPDLTKRHTFYPGKEFSNNGYSDNFFVYTPDLNGDGWQDVLVLGFPGKEARWYENPGANTATWKMHVVLDVVDNESPEFTDITGDGKPEIVCSQNGRFGYASPAADSNAKWEFVPLTDDVKVQRFTHGMGVGDVDGDGRLDLLESRRWWKNTPGEAVWPSRTFQLTGGGGAQMFAYDFDGDGDNDVVSSLNAHQFGVAWFENQAGKGGDGPSWVKHTIVGQEPWENEYGVRFSQPHALALVDVDGDGLKDIITGKRYWAHNGHDPNERDPRVIYWFKTQRDKKGGVSFVPHLMDSASGVGTQLTTGDVNGDGLVDVVIGNKAGCYVLVQKREQVEAARYAQFQPRKIYGPDSLRSEAYVVGQSAADAVKNMVVPEGFKVDLIAAEPDLVQPIAMCWDERGRIWVVEGNTYPQPAKPGEGRDRILIFEDMDGNGSFETRKVFMEKLNLVSGIEVGFGGVWIGAAPNFLFIPDKDHDDKPDGEPVALLDGWGNQDTHETLNSFIWGPDGWLYGCHGVFTHSLVGRPGTPDKERQPLNAGVWRYHPTQHKFEVFAHGTSNPWGLDFNDHGEFFVTACVIPHLYHILPGGRYQRQAGQHFNPYTYDDIKTIAEHRHYAGEVKDHAAWGDRKELKNLAVPASTDQAGGGHAHCGLAIYQGDNFPELYRGALLFGNLHGHRLVHNAVEPALSGYTGQRRPDFMRSNDHWFIPVTQRVGPDGALYVSDWYDEQTCHHKDVQIWNRTNGRIFRVVYDQLNTAWAKDLPAGKSDTALVGMLLDSSNSWQARMAQRLLMEKAEDGRVDDPAKDALRAALNGSGPVERRLKALWGLSVIGSVEQTLLTSLLDRPEPELRAWSVRLMGQLGIAYRPALHDALERLAQQEKSPLVRRELASLLQRLPLPERSKIALGLIGREEDKQDPNIPLLLWYGIEPLVGADGEAGLKLAASSKLEQVTGYIYRRMAGSDEGRQAILAAIAVNDDAGERERLLNLLVASARGSGKLAAPKEWAGISGKLRAGASEPVKALVDELSAYFGDPAAVQKHRELLMDKAAAGSRRDRALQVLLQVRDDQSAVLMQQLVVNGDAALTRSAVQALASLSHPETPVVLTKVYASLAPAEKADAVATLASSAAGAQALLRGVEDKSIARDALSPFLVRQLQALKNPEVDGLIEKVWGTVNASKADLPQRKAKYKALLTPERLKKADLVQGKLMYGGTCGACHRMLGEGANVGPDLTGSNRGNLDYLLENVLDPNAVIGKAYQLNLFSMNDGRVLSGIVQEETDSGYKVVMPGGVEFSLTKAEVKSREISKFSTMPEGQFDALPPEQVVNLVAYLQQQTAGGGAAAAAKVEGAIEGETMQGVTVSKGQARAQNMGGFGGQWSQARQLWWTGGTPGETMAITLPVTKAGKYTLKAALTKARDYASIEVILDGEVIPAASLDLYSVSVISTGELDWGTHVLQPGDHKLVVKISGANPAAAQAFMVGLDYLKLEAK